MYTCIYMYMYIYIYMCIYVHKYRYTSTSECVALDGKQLDVQKLVQHNSDLQCAARLASV